MLSSTSSNLVLRNGTILPGTAFGAAKAAAGELVFATGMVGYPEALTDPSFAGQIIVMTYPLVGNYGVPPKKSRNIGTSFFESRKIWAAGVVVSSVYDDRDQWQAAQGFSAWLKSSGVPGIAGVDTRQLAKLIRERGTGLAKLLPGKTNADWYDPNATHIVAEVSEKKPRTFGRGKKTVLVVDCGVKWNIIRSLVSRGVRVKVVPWDWDFTREKYHGLLISNGPGDPTRCGETIVHLKKALRQKKPIFGICLGNQLLALAAGAKTGKLPYGHRSQNQPATDLLTGRCYITTQNHGFHVLQKTLPAGWRPWFINANDGTNEGIRHVSKPFFSVQFHPEAAPGPEDTGWLFDEFVRLL